jgi:hypothetical protein
MAGAAGAKNVYKTGVLVGNWNEDQWGADLARRVESSHPQLETTTYRATHASDAWAPRETSKPALKGFDALDGHLMMAHAPSANAIADRHEAPDRYMTVYVPTVFD